VRYSFFSFTKIGFQGRPLLTDPCLIGYDDYQSYLLLGCAPVQGHVAGIVDIPNACTTMGVPVDIFDFDIMPHVKAEKKDMGSCAFASSK
jgi:formamidase